ncbi:hypothetical protein ABT095_01030 [Kitasatospora sp. NPDC002227]|uniref:hypothetical protein n=1 Tax=Kitasatospora sp. NPDC002227 TaxID=3154773 RepID=UPI00332B6941
MDRETIRKYLAPAEASGMAPGGPPTSEADWGKLIKGWFPELARRRLNQVPGVVVDGELGGDGGAQHGGAEDGGDDLAGEQEGDGSAVDPPAEPEGADHRAGQAAGHRGDADRLDRLDAAAVGRPAEFLVGLCCLFGRGVVVLKRPPSVGG